MGASLASCSLGGSCSFLLCGLHRHSGCRIGWTLEVGNHQLLETIIKFKDRTHLVLQTADDASGTNIPVPADQITVERLEIPLKRDYVLLDVDSKLVTHIF